MPSDATALKFLPLTPQRMDAMGEVLRGGWGAGCWCMYPRLTESEMRSMKEIGPLSGQRRTAMAEFAARSRAPGLLAFEKDIPVGWVAVAPREEFHRIEISKAMPRVDDTSVWIIPCVTVRGSERGRGIAVALIRAAVAYAFKNGAPAVEAYPRAGGARSDDGNVYSGTEAMFRRAGFTVIRPPPENLPRNWIPRVTMRVKAT